METPHKSDLLWAIKEIHKAESSFDLEEENRHYNSARTRLNNALRHDTNFLPAQILYERSTQSSNLRINQIHKILRNFPGSKIRNAILYLDIAKVYAKKYWKENDVNEKSPNRLKVIEYVKKATDETPHNSQVIEEAFYFFDTLGAYKEAKALEEKLLK